MTDSATADLKTIGGLIVWAQQALDKAGTTNSAQEARWLLACALELSSHELASRTAQLVTVEHQARAKSLVSRRTAREPLQYILGSQEFCGLDFQVTPAVLIPRPETELLVQETLREGGGFPDGAVLVDVGTGSGCVAVTLATILNGSKIYAMDHSKEALAVAKGNAETHGVVDKIMWLEGDLLAPLRDQNVMGGVDAIVSNPPYIPECDWAGLQPEVRDFEPKQALIAGKNGTEFHERLLRDSKEFLAPGGLLVMEMGQGQAQLVQHLAERMGGYTGIRTVKDEAEIDRVIIARRVS